MSVKRCRPYMFLVKAALCFDCLRDKEPVELYRAEPFLQRCRARPLRPYSYTRVPGQL